MKNWIIRNRFHLINTALLFAICFCYFQPAFQGKTLAQGDVIGARSTQTEINHYKQKDTTILWTNQIFGGMPAFQIWAPYPKNMTTWVVRGLTTIFPAPIYNVLLLLFGSYFLFSVFKLTPWLAAAGAAAFTFSSYNIILIVAGHTNQVFAIAFFAPLLAGVILTLQGKYVWGAAVTAFFLAMEIRANHLQMTYYILLTILLLLAVELVNALRSKTVPAFLKSVIYLAGAALIAMMVNASLLWSTYEYSNETIRGPSNLHQITKENPGLGKVYAYQYSQGISECLTFIVPNAAGGGLVTEKADINSEAAKVLLEKGFSPAQTISLLQKAAKIPGLALYWGEKRPFTYGPHYFGAVICFLFISGLVVVRHPLKYWIAGTVTITVVLSLGGNWPLLPDLFYQYVPFYNKFRGPESILAVTALFVTLLAMLTIQEIVNTKNRTALFSTVKIIFFINCFLLLILILAPTMLLKFTPHDATAGLAGLTKLLEGDGVTASDMADAIIQNRVRLEQADALRSLLFIALTSTLLWAFTKRKLNTVSLSILIFAVILTDLWQMDKRHLRFEDFKDKHLSSEPKIREVDRIIYKDKDPDYRVVDLSQPPTYDLVTPFFHKSIWGYSEVRLKRFDEVLEHHFSYNVNHPVLDMLNTKYILFKDPKTHILEVQVNKPACGHAWFVKDITYVKNANEEIKAIATFSPGKTAIVDEKYKIFIPGSPLSDSNAKIDLVQYRPDHLSYKSTANTSQVAVFSEVHYEKGWKMYIDGKEKPFFRADYLLRAAVIPPGLHRVDFIFHPGSYYIGEDISLAGSLLLLSTMGCVVITRIRRKRLN